MAGNTRRRAGVGHGGRAVCALPKNVNFYTLGYEEPLHNFKPATDKNRFPVWRKRTWEKCGGDKASSATQDSQQDDRSKSCLTHGNAMS